MRFQTAKVSSILITLCCLQAVAQAQKLKTFSSQYGPFNESYYKYLEILPPAAISNGAIQLTPDSAIANYDLSDLSGRILLKQPFRLWDGDITANASRVASFNTSFLINIYRLSNMTRGEGLAFVIAPDMNLPPQSSGRYLGLTSWLTDGKSSNKLVAIEVDTNKQDFDPDANHIGLDINSIRSVKYESLTPHGIDIAPMGGKFFNFWVQYDGVNKVIEVYIAEQTEIDGPTPPRPSSPILKSNLDLREYVNEYSYFGFSASAGDGTQLNVVLRWNLTVEYFPEDKKPLLKIVLGAGVLALVLLLMGAAWLGYYLHKRRTAQSNLDIVRKLKCLPATPREFKFRKLKKATNNFDEKNKLGQGGFGVVYRGKLAGEDSEIAVKWFSRESIKGQDDFLAELTIINRLRHKHLVRLLGWCHRNMKLLLVYEYMPNGSLDQHLFAGPAKEPLNWNLRYDKIISGVASALHYLHNEYDQKVVHRDLKASNIMLDANFNARLGDFGLARALDNEKTSFTEAEGVMGTIGYIAPECFLTGKATQQSDVYAFGAVVLETVCGLRPGTKISGFQFLVDWVWFLHRDGRLLEAVDEILGDEYVAEEAEKLLLLGLACSHPTASERPNAQDIVQILSGTKPAPDVPPFKPAFLWPAVAPIDITSSIDGTKSITTSHLNSGWRVQYLSQESCAQDADHSMV